MTSRLEDKPLSTFAGRLGIVQRVVPGYRRLFFEGLAQRCERGLGLFAGESTPGEGLSATWDLAGVHMTRATARRFLAGSAEVLWQRGVRTWLDQWQPDVLVVEANPRYLSTPFAVAWMHRRGRPVLGWGLGTLQLAPGLRSLRAFLRNRFLTLFDGLMAYSERAAREYVAAGVPADRVFVVHNATAPRPREVPVARPGRFAGRPTVVFVGRLNPGKRVDALLTACAGLPVETRPRLLIVGEGESRGALQSRARDVYPEAEFLGDLRGAALLPMWQSADLFVLPGLGGLAVQEAMAQGLPVVVADGDGTQFDLVSSENGWHVRPGDVAQLTDVLAQALSDPARLRRMGAASFRVIDEAINVERMVDDAIVALRAISQRSRLRAD
jgi:glycosyltransferase involved in cell wall biosynthesis